MTIKKDTWHYKAYLYWTRRSSTYRADYRENLCHYMRVLLIWAPLVWLDAQLGRIPDKVGWALVFLVVGAPLAFLTTRSAVVHPTRFYMAIGSLAGLLVILTWLFFVVFRRFPVAPKAVRVGVKEGAVLGWAYAKARKRRVCPFIDFEEVEVSVS